MPRNQTVNDTMYTERILNTCTHIKNSDWVRSQCICPSCQSGSSTHKWIGSISLAVVRNVNKTRENITTHSQGSTARLKSTACDYQIFRSTCATARLTRSACLGSFKGFYLRVCAALSNVSQTYVDYLNAMLIRIHSLLKILLFIAEL